MAYAELAPGIVVSILYISLLLKLIMASSWRRSPQRQQQLPEPDNVDPAHPYPLITDEDYPYEVPPGKPSQFYDLIYRRRINKRWRRIWFR